MGYKIININITILKMVNDIFLKNGKVDIKAHNRLQPNTYSVSVVISKYNMTAMKNHFSVSLFSLRVKLIELLLVIMKRIFVIGSGGLSWLQKKDIEVVVVIAEDLHY